MCWAWPTCGSGCNGPTQIPAAGVEARTAGTELEGWQGIASRSYAWQVSSILGDFLQRTRGEVAQLAGQIQQAANRLSADERLRARQRAISVILKTFFWSLLLVLVVLAGIAALGWARWPFAFWTGGVMLGLYIGVSLALFLLAQRDLFAEMNLRRSQMGELEAMQANLRTALQDVSRLSTAYGQLLSWCRVLGAVLRAPFGPAPAARPSPGQLFDGLPRSTQLGVADPGEQQAGNAAHAIQRRLYALGWMTQPWQDMINEVAARLREEPDMLFRMPGIGTQSGLDQWSYAVASGRVQPTGADALWSRVEQMFAEEHIGVADALTGTVLVPGLGPACSGAAVRCGHHRAPRRAGRPVRRVAVHPCRDDGGPLGGGDRRGRCRARRTGLSRGGGAGQ